MKSKFFACLSKIKVFTTFNELSSIHCQSSRNRTTTRELQTSQISNRIARSNPHWLLTSDCLAAQPSSSSEKRLWICGAGITAANKPNLGTRNIIENFSLPLDPLQSVLGESSNCQQWRQRVSMYSDHYPLTSKQTTQISTTIDRVVVATHGLCCRCCLLFL